LGDENPDWQGNFAVRYWDPAWQSLIFGQASAYLDLVLDAGFDGAYLDRVDAFDLPDTMLPRRQRMRLMSDFVARLADYARKKRPGFLILGQNAEELLADPVYAAAIDGVAKEDLFFGLEGDAVANAKAEIRESLRALLDFRRQSGKPIFLVEYLSDPSDILLAQSYARQMDAPLFIADRELDDATSR
jgi:cysteinyl-tRNA synthetase